MKRHNLIADIFIWIFGFVSFFTFAIAQIKNDTTSIWISVLIYVVPLLIATINDITDRYLKRELLILSGIAIVSGVLLITLSLILTVNNIKPNVCVKIILIVFSSIFMIRNTYIIVREFMKHYNTQLNFVKMEEM